MKTKQKKCLICGKRKTKFTTLPNKQDACIMCALTIVSNAYSDLVVKYTDLYRTYLIEVNSNLNSRVTND